jgi:hypothetical protein
MKKSIYMVLDTETADLSGNVYDIGWTICDNKGNIFDEYNALVNETFTDPEKMMGAFYANKLFTHYAPMLFNQDIEMKNWIDVLADMNNAIEDWEVTCIAAYNAGFDFRVMGNTHKNLGYTGKVLSHKVKTLDIWQFACETKLKTRTYKKIAQEQGWVSSKGNLKSGAEFAYRFCSGDFGFIEDHTALSDARIETEILAACLATRRKIPYGKINGSPWRIIQ